jgi:cobyrinic acid a,c-diamide synthase
MVSREALVSVPRIIVAGVESGPALDLVAGALLAGLGEQRTVRPILLGLDVPLWRLLYEASPKAPRVIDPVLHEPAIADELVDHWIETVDFALVVAVRPLLDSWEGLRGSRATDTARRMDAPIILALDARDRGPTAAAAVHGVRALVRDVELGGIVLVGLDDSSSGAELVEVLRRDVGLPILGHIPPQLSEQFTRQRGVLSGAVRTVGARPTTGGSVQLCREAATYLKLEEITAVAARRGFVPSPPRRLLVPDATATDVSVAVAWGEPLQPLVLENVDLLQAMGVRLLPLNIARDRELPENCDGLLLVGTVDEDELAAFAGNEELLTVLREEIGDGLPTLAFGGGALLLVRRLSDSRGRSHDMLGLVPCEAEVIEWFDRPHYVKATATRDNPYDEGEALLFELFDLEFLVMQQERFPYEVRVADGSPRSEGFVAGRCLASSLFASFPACPSLAGRFVAAMAAARGV